MARTVNAGGPEQRGVVPRENTVPMQGGLFHYPNPLLPAMFAVDLVQPPRGEILATTAPGDLLTRMIQLFEELEVRKKREEGLLQDMESRKKKLDELLQHLESRKRMEVELLQRLESGRRKESALLQDLESMKRKKEGLQKDLDSRKKREEGLHKDLESKRKREVELLQEGDTLQKERDEWSGLCSKSIKTMKGLECELEEEREKQGRYRSEMAAFLALLQSQAAHRLQEQLGAIPSNKHPEVAILLSQLADLEKNKAAIMTRILE